MLDVLIALQRERGLNDGPFAESIGVSREYWNRMRHGRHNLTLRVVQNALLAYPQIHRDARIFLLGSDRKVSTVMLKAPSNIDAEASERTRTLVLTSDRATLACRGTAPTGQGQGGSVSVQSVPRTAGKDYVTKLAPASDPARRASDAAEAS